MLVKIEPHDNYLYVQHTYARLSLEVALELMKKIAAACEEYKLSRVFIDARDYVREGSTLDFYRFSTSLAELGLAAAKIAVVPNREKLVNEDATFIENVAWNRGQRFRFFISEKEAMAWLMGDD